MIQDKYNFIPYPLSLGAATCILFIFTLSWPAYNNDSI